MNLLYKYKQLSQYENNELTLNEYTLNLLVKGEVYFPNPTQLNDPFDAYILFKKQYNEEDAIKYFKSIDPEQSEERIKFYVKNVFKYEEYVSNFIENNRKTYKLFCVTNDYKNLLMWSHYANNHKGICIGFKTHNHNNKTIFKFLPKSISDDPQVKRIKHGFLNVNKVNYPETRLMPPPINPFNYTKQEFIEFMYTKTVDWEYENEYRIVLPDLAFKYKSLTIDLNEIKEIRFGALVSDKTISLLASKLCSIKEYDDCKFYKANLKPHHYSLDFIEINIKKYLT